MINLYLSPSCTSCRKARVWFNSYGVPFEEHNILTQPMTAEDLKSILAKQKMEQRILSRPEVRYFKS